MLQMHTIHEITSRITNDNMDGIELTAQSPSTEKNSSTPTTGVPIVTNTSLYASFLDYKKNFKPIYIHDIKFFPFLVPKEGKPWRQCLFDKNFNHDYYTMIVAMDGTKDPNTDKFIGPKKRFAAFRSPLDFFIWQNEYFPNPESRCFYEVIRSGPQNPHFDIDIDSIKDVYLQSINLSELADRILHETTRAIINSLAMKNIPCHPSDIMHFNSNGETKKSFHIVLPRVCHTDEIEAEAFASVVRSMLPPDIAKFVDSKVYSSNQQFRLFGSQKRGSGRTKIIMPVTYDGSTYNYHPILANGEENNPEIVAHETFSDSLVSFRPTNYLPSYYDVAIQRCTDISHKIKTIVKGHSSIKSDIVDDKLQSNIQRLFECNSTLRRKYTFTGAVENGFFVLRNNQEVTIDCPICNRNHEHENAYIISVSGKAYFDCRRRSDNMKRLLLGQTNSNINDQHENEEEDKDGDFTFGDYDIGAPTLPPTVKLTKEHKSDTSLVPITKYTNVTNTFLQNKQVELLANQQQRVQAVPTNGLIPTVQQTPKRVPARAIINGLTAPNVVSGQKCPSDTCSGTGRQQSVQTHDAIDEEICQQDHPTNTSSAITTHKDTTVHMDNETPDNDTRWVALQVKEGQNTQNISDRQKCPNDTYSATTSRQHLQTRDGIDGEISANKLYRPNYPINTCSATNTVDDTIIHIDNVKLDNDTRRVALQVKEGQTKIPDESTTIGTFLEGNTKFISGVEYIILVLYEAYERYRCGKGAKYIINGGGPRNFGSNLTSLGHLTDQKKIDKDNVRVVILKRNVVRTLDVSTARPIVLTDEMKKAPVEPLIIQQIQPNLITHTPVETALIQTKPTTPTPQQVWDSLHVPKLRGDHTQDNRSMMRRISELVLGRLLFVLILKAVCGLGKTIEIVAELANNPNESVLVVCGRKTLGRKQLDDLIAQGFVYYETLGKGIIKDVPKLIIQIDSLWRVRGNYNYLILDELCMTEDQLVDFVKRKKECVDALIERIRRTPKVIVADAFMTDDDVDLFRMLRPQDILIYENTYPKQQDKELFVVNNHGKFIDLISRALGENKKVISPCGSKDDVKTLEAKYKHTDKVVKTYTGDDVIEEDPTLSWGEADLCIFTSVCIAGNSFVERHFHKAFGYFTPMTFTPESAAQMLLRARQLIDNEMYVYVGPHKKLRFPTTITNITLMKEYLQRDDIEARKDLYGVIPMSYVDDIIDYTHPYFHIYATVMLRKHLGVMNFEKRLMTLLKSQGIRFGGVISTSNKEDQKRCKEISRNYTDAKKDVRYQGNVDITEGRLLTYDQAKEISENEKATKADKDALKKYYLMNRYQLETITPEFVEANMHKLQQHRNISACAELSVDCDEPEKLRIMTDIQSKMFHGEGVEVDGKVIVPHITERIRNTERMLNYKRCMYLINILRLLGIPKFLDGGVITRTQYQNAYDMIQRHYGALGIENFSQLVQLFDSHLGIEIVDLDYERQQTPILSSENLDDPILDCNNKYQVINHYRKANDRNLYLPMDMKGSTLTPIKEILRTEEIKIETSKKTETTET